MNILRRTAGASLAVCITLAQAAQAAPASRRWPAIVAAAKGQTVYWNAWGGDERTNAFIAWAGGEVKRRYGITIEQVKLTDTAEAVTRVFTHAMRRGLPTLLVTHDAADAQAAAGPVLTLD